MNVFFVAFFGALLVVGLGVCIPYLIIRPKCKWQIMADEVKRIIEDHGGLK